MKRSDIMPFVSNLQNSPGRTLTPLFCLSFLGILFLAFNNAAIAATYYLDAVSGNDGNSGTSEQPWQTISKAQSVIQSGDTVILRDGNYGCFSQHNIGYNNWVTYKADSGHNPILTCIFVRHDDKKDMYLRFDGITINGPIPAGNNPNDPPWKWNETMHIVNFSRISYVELLNCCIKAENKYLANFGVYLLDADNVRIDHCDIKWLKAGFLVLSGKNIKISYNHIHALSRGSGISLRPFGDINPSLPCNILIEGNHIHDVNYNKNDDYFPPDIVYVARGDSPWNDPNRPPAFGDNDIISQGTVRASFKGVRWNGTNWEVYVLMETPSKFQGEIECVSSPGGITFIPTAHLEKFHVGSGLAIHVPNVCIRNNIVHNFPGQGIYFYGGTAYKNMVVENNLLYDIGNYTSFSQISGPCLIRNNTFIGRVQKEGNPDNSIQQTLNITDRYGGLPFLVDFEDDFNGTGVEICNNLTVGQLYLPDPNKHPYYVEKNNIWWSRNYDKGALPADSTSKVAVWQQYPYILHGNPNYFENIEFTGTTPEYSYAFDGIQPFFVNPGFKTNPSIEKFGTDKGKVWDYHLAAGSPGINFGDPNNQPGDSLGNVDPNGFIRNDGLSRDANHHSAGCYESNLPAYTNHPPVFDPIGNKTIAAGSVLTFTVKATDADGDLLVYWATDLPQGATFNHVTKTFTWTPAKNQIGVYTVTFKVRNKTLIIAKTITITVGKLITVPADANSIQKAINLANDGDTVAIEQGRYRENIHFNGKNIILKSLYPDNPGIAANTIIDGNGAGSVVTFGSSAPALIDTSISFSTGTDGENSWSMTKSGDVVTLSFGSIEIDCTDPDPDSVISDKVSLPSMTLTDITMETISGFGDIYQATLNPVAGSMLTITSDIDGTTKMTARVGVGEILIAGTTWIAFSTSDNDLTNINAATPGYSAIIDNMASGGNRTVDFSLGGTSSTLLSALLGLVGDGTAGGTLSGQINATSPASNKDAACELAGFTITGGNAMQGGGIYIDSVCPTIEKNIITANNAVEGGGIYCRDGPAIIRLNKITGNKTAFGIGGAICGVNSSATIANNLIADNTAYYGSGIVWFEGKPTIVNNTIACNSSTLNSFTCGILVDSGEPSSFIRNNIIAFNNNGAGIYGISELAPASFTYNNVFSNSSGNYGGKLTDQTGRNGNISADPFFFDIYNKDFHLKSSTGRWDAGSRSWLTDIVTSPCIDKGDPNDNFAGELWPHGQRINMGAFGGTPQAGMSESNAGGIADLNNDGIVDYVDMAIFTQKWLSNETSLHEDLNRDGIVNFKDFAILGIQYDDE